MKIHFCDLCNESVPQADLDQAKAFIRRGRVICANCDRAMSPHPGDVPAGATPTLSAAEPSAMPPVFDAPQVEAPPPVHSFTAPVAVHTTAPARGGSGALWIAVLGLLFTAGAIFVLDDRIHELRDSRDAMQKGLDKNVRAEAVLERNHAALDEAHQTLEKRLIARFDAEKARADAMEEQLASQKKDEADAQSKLATTVQAVAVLQEKAGSGGADLEKRLADQSARIAKQEDQIRAQNERLAKLETASAAQPAVVAAQDPAKPAEPAWHALIEDLKSPNETTRWTAVDELGKSNDPAIAPFVIPMLKDSNVFVRMGAARVLGIVQAKAAIGPLIDALEDADSPVRDAAFVALRSVTGKDFKFDSLAGEAERAKRVKAWREWFKKDSEAGS